MNGGMKAGAGVWAVHLAVLAALAVAGLLLPAYHMTNLARIMVLAVFAMGYNLAFGYAGLLSRGHAMFFAAGMYGAGLPVWHWGWSAGPALMGGTLAGGVLALAVGLLALRTAGVSFMIVTLMFAQAFALSILYFNDWTHGDEGFVLADTGRSLLGWSMAADGPRYAVAWALFAAGLVISVLLVRSRFGRVMVALRENEERARMLGIDPFAAKLRVLVISGLFSGRGRGLCGAVRLCRRRFRRHPYSILPMLYVLIGGAGTVLGAGLGAGIMFYLTDFASSLTSAWLFLVGAALVVLVLFAPRGILGFVRARLWRDLP
ncbi:MAG: branched-chain amino acid ABC transporter permease [Paracoccaceae bacterium]